MEQRSFFITMSDGHDVFVRTYTPSKKRVGHIHILHGMSEHSGRYESFAEKLCDEGYFVSAHDHRGHGFTAQKNGTFGYFGPEKGFELVVEDVLEVLSFLKKETTERPILFGHSMGSFIARRIIQQDSDKIERLILSGSGSPTLLHQVGHIVAKQLVKLQGAKIQSDIMNDLSFSSFNRRIKDPQTNFDWLSTDGEQVQKYIDDPFCGIIATNQFFVDLTGGMLMLKNERANAHIRSDLKVLLVSGAYDPIAGPEAIGALQVGKQLAHAGVEHVKVHLFEGMRHEILNEKKKEQVIEIIVRWLKDE